VKLRHAAAIALVGWYLLEPPLNHLSRIEIAGKCNRDAPLLEWKQAGAFERISDCQAQQKKEPDDIKKIVNAIDDASSATKNDKAWEVEEILCASLARCIATDDSRLKSN
jgi:hypothetical protein